MKIFSYSRLFSTSSVVCLLFVSLFVISKESFAQTITINDESLGTGTYNWTNNNTYVLDGFVYLESGGVLNIQAGTVIKAKASPSSSDNASALIITVGARIEAEGTAEQPIIFTSEIDDLNESADLTATDRGLWGGLILLGDGILGNTTVSSNIEGIPTTETRAQFGGTNNENNVGTLKYVSIRHGGTELSPGNEINGLTLGGVGSGTVVEHIEVFSNLDDGIEIFGGAVNIKNAAVAFCGDDGFDWDLGWVGNGQFWFVLQGSDAADNGGEWDGAKPDGNSIYSNPTVYNLTFIGSGTESVSANNTNAILMRDATAGTVANSIFTEYANKALEIEDLPSASGIDSYTRLQNGEISLLNNLWYGFNTFTTLDANPNTGIIRFTTGGDDNSCTYLINHLTTNNNQISNPMLNSISRLPNGLLDPRPQVDSPALLDLAASPVDAFFTAVDYKGAFDSVENNLWIDGWSALSEYGYLPTTTSVNELYARSNSEINLYPNPTSGVVFIELTNATVETCKLEVYDLSGKLITEIGNKFQNGNRKVSWNTDALVPGVYLLKASTPSVVYSKPFIVQ
ncbi:MAG: hypothetical protein COA49_02905 [Bacteroidetes bacterium]|nr:MAG: hypothetical protein COA49_02905 [Bacteroidota bacterium]